MEINSHLTNKSNYSFLNKGGEITVVKVDKEGNKTVMTTFKENNIHDSVIKFIQDLGGIDSPLFSYAGQLYYTPNLWEVVSNRMKEHQKNAYIGIQNWFALQGYNDIIDLKIEDQVFIPLQVSNFFEIIPKSYRDKLPKNISKELTKITVFINNPVFSRYKDAVWLKLFKNLFLLASKHTIISSILNYRPYEKIEKNGTIKKRYLPRVSQVIKVAAGVSKNLSLYTIKFDQELISAGYRLAYFEFEPNKRIVDTSNLDTLFNRYNNHWIALRNPFIPDNDYKFLVMADDMISSFLAIVMNLITEGKTSVSDINRIRRMVELSNCQLLKGCETYSYREAIETGAFQNRIERNKPLPQTLEELLVEVGRGALNDLLIGLFSSVNFRQAINSQGAKMILTNKKVPVIYVGSYTKGGDTEFDDQTTMFIPDATTKISPNMKYPEYLLIKNERFADATKPHHGVIDLMKQQNSHANPYRTFQMNIYTKKEIFNFNHLTQGRKRELLGVMSSHNAHGIIRFSFPKKRIKGLPRFAEVFNGARILFEKEYKMGAAVPTMNKIYKDLLSKLKTFQPSTNWDLLEDDVRSMIEMFDFHTSSQYDFLEKIFWNFVPKWLILYNNSQ